MPPPFPDASLRVVLCALLLLAGSAVVSARAGELALSHQAPVSAPEGGNLAILGLAAGLEDGSGVTVHHRSLDTGDFESFELVVRGGHFDGFIPGEFVRTPGLEYYLSAVDEDGIRHTLPIGVPEYPAFRVRVGSEHADPRTRLGSPPSIRIVAPLSGAQLEREDLVLIATLGDEDGDLEAAGVRLLVNGRDLSVEAAFRAGLLVWIPSPDLPPGPLRIEIEARDRAGNLSRSEVLDMDLLRPGGKPVEPGFFARAGKPQGSLVLDSRVTGLEGEGADLRQEPDRTLRARLGLRGKLSWLDYRAHAFLTSDESSDAQARNRYRLDLEAGPLRLSAGDVTPRFNPLVIWGRRLRGMELELKSGVMDAQLLYGSIQRAVEGEGRDSLDVTAPGGIRPIVENAGSYRRELKALRFGSKTDQAVGLSMSLLKIKDDTGSIRYGTRPKDNIVLGADLKIGTFGRRLLVDAAVAMSFLTDDISDGALSREEADSTLGIRLPFDPLSVEGLLIINGSTTPLDMRGMSNLAFETSARSQVAGNLLDIRFRRIGPVYHSLAATSLPRDHQGFRVRDSFSFFARRLRVSGEYERYHDNLVGDREHTRDSDVIAGNLTWVPRAGRVTGLNAGFRLHGQNNGVSDELEGVDNVTLLLALGAGLQFPLGDFRENLRLSLVSTSRTDHITEAGDSRGSNAILESRTFFPGMPLSLGGLLGLSRNSYPGLESMEGTLGIEADFTTVQLDLDYDRPKMPMRLSWRTVSGNGDMTGADSGRSSLDLRVDYRFNPDLTLNGRVGWVGFDDRSSENQDYNETFLELGLRQAI